MPEEFFKALDIPILEAKGSWSCRVVPLYVRRIPNLRQGHGHSSIYYLLDVACRQRRAVRVLTVTHDTTILTWTIEQARDYIMDNIAEAMRTIMLHEVKYSPLRQWSDAARFFSWCSSEDCCILFPFTEIALDDVRVQRPVNNAWLQMPISLAGMVVHPGKGSLQHIKMEERFKEELLQVGTIEHEMSPCKQPRKKNKGHAIPIHAEIILEGTQQYPRENGRVQGQPNDSLNFEE